MTAEAGISQAEVTVTFTVTYRAGFVSPEFIRDEVWLMLQEAEESGFMDRRAFIDLEPGMPAVISADLPVESDGDGSSCDDLLEVPEESKPGSCNDDDTSGY